MYAASFQVLPLVWRVSPLLAISSFLWLTLNLKEQGPRVCCGRESACCLLVMSMPMAAAESGVGIADATFLELLRIALTLR